MPCPHGSHQPRQSGTDGLHLHVRCRT
jgi:hypothetical protein